MCCVDLIRFNYVYIDWGEKLLAAVIDAATQITVCN